MSILTPHAAGPRRVATLVGSLRKGSYTRKVALALAELSRGSLELDLVEIGDLPLYNQDLDTDAPPRQWSRLRERIKSADAVLFATPEYNRSVPGVLKNAIDVASRPYGHNVFDAKPAAVLSTSTGALSGFGANHHLRQSLVFLNVPVMQQPEAYIGNSDKLFDESGALINDSTADFLAKFAYAFSVWIETHSLVLHAAAE
jgi:chromate reductase